MKSLQLNGATWDLTVDANNNIGTIDGGAALAQNAASACRLFKGELWYNTLLGVPYWAQILAKSPPLSLIKAQFVAAALTVSGVASAKCFISSLKGRQIAGQIQVTDKTGTTTVATF